MDALLPPSPSSGGPDGHGSRLLDSAALQRAARRVAAGPAAPWLHGEVARRMAQRLGVVRMQPQGVLDWGAPRDGSRALLQAAYPGALVSAVAPEPPAAGPQAWWSPRRWFGERGVRVLDPRQVEPGQAGLVWANMVLHGQPDPTEALRQWHRALGVDGFLMFSTFGPGTLGALRSLYDDQGWGPPMAPMVDMHDLGDMLIETGFADPVMDQEEIVLTWPDAQAALEELRTLGANVHPGRAPGLRTPRWRDRLLEGLRATAGADGRVRLGFEIAYGHAFRPAPRPRLEVETRVDLADMRMMMRAGRGSG